MESAALISTLEHEHEHDPVIWLRPEEAALRPLRFTTFFFSRADARGHSPARVSTTSFPE
jgi:hypothetical protein